MYEEDIEAEELSAEAEKVDEEYGRQEEEEEEEEASLT